MNARKSCGPFEISSYFQQCRCILFTTRSAPFVGETTDDPRWTFRPLAFRTFMIYSWRSQNARERERVHASSEQPNEQRPARRHGKRVTMHYDLLCKRYAWDRYMYKRSCLSRCMKCSLDISEMWTFVCFSIRDLTKNRDGSGKFCYKSRVSNNERYRFHLWYAANICIKSAWIRDINISFY